MQPEKRRTQAQPCATEVDSGVRPGVPKGNAGEVPDLTDPAPDAAADESSIAESERFIVEWDQLLRSITRLRGRLSQLAPPARLSNSHYWIVRIISASQPCRLSDVARAVGMSVPGASQQVLTLEKRGLVTREKDTSDGRSILLRMTAAGEAALAVRAQEARKRIRHIADELTADERRAAISLLPRLREIMEEIDTD